MNSFFQAISFVFGMFAASQNPLPEQHKPLPMNENPYTTDDSWDCYTLVDSNGRPLEHVCETEHSPCHYKRKPSECKHTLRWDVP